MPIFLKISKHSPENCPMVAEHAKKISLEVTSKMGELGKKHGVKVLGAWAVHQEHLLVMVYEAATLDAFQKFLMEPVVMKWINIQDTTEFKLAMTLEESMKLIK